VEAENSDGQQQVPRLLIKPEKSEDEQCEKFFECIFTASKHFSEGAQIEYNAPAGSRQFERAAVPPAPATRDFRACELHTTPLRLWQAVRSRLPGFAKREPSARTVAPTAQTIEQGAYAGDNAFAGFAHRPGAGGCWGEEEAQPARPGRVRPHTEPRA
jgi:hypothetical protein